MDTVITEDKLIDYTHESLSPLTIQFDKNNKLYFVSLDDERNSHITCVNVETGKMEWRTSLEFGSNTNLCVTDKLVAYGSIILDSSNGSLVHDIRTYSDDLKHGSKVGISFLSEDMYLKTLSGYSYDDGYFKVELSSKTVSIVKLNSFIRPEIESSGNVIGCSNRKLTSFSLLDNAIAWDRMLSEIEDDFCVLTKYSGLIDVKYNDRIYSIHQDTGDVVNIIELNTVIDKVGKPASYIGSTVLRSNKNYIVIGKVDVGTRKGKSWLAVIDRVTNSIIAHSIMTIKGSFCIQGDLLYTANADDYPICLDLRTLEQRWRGETAISTKLIMINDNYVVYYFVGGGFQVYKI